MFTRKRKSRADSPLLGRTVVLSNDVNEHKYLPEKCRVCLDDGEIPIFGVKDISHDVTEFGNIEVAKGDKLPQYLCEACYTLLEAAILFRKTAQQADQVLRGINHSSSEDSDSKQDNEPFIKREYLEFNNISDSENDTFDRIKLEDCKSDDETSHYNFKISELDSKSVNDCNNLQMFSSNIKEEDTVSVKDADGEMIMIIVSDKDKQKLQQIEKNDAEVENIQNNILEVVEKAPVKILPHQRECDVCHTIVNKKTYKEHLKEHREKYKVQCGKKHEKVECKFCGKPISKPYIKHHLKMHGTPEEQAERLIECSFCKKTFSIRYYSDHVRRVHSKKSNKTKNLSENEDVEEIKTQVLKYNKCPVCDRDIKESEFKMHLERHGGPLKRYICDKCGKVFKHPSAFKTHLLTHGSELKYKCQFCPYRGLHQALLKIHVRTHTGDYNYKCSQCPAKFITKSNLSRHLQRHTGESNFKCATCGKGFYTNRDLERHAKNTHVALKNHVCEICGKAFGHRDNMLSHQLKVHKRDKKKSRGRMPSYLKADQSNSVEAE